LAEQPDAEKLAAAEYEVLLQRLEGLPGELKQALGKDCAVLLHPDLALDHVDAIINAFKHGGESAAVAELFRLEAVIFSTPGWRERVEKRWRASVRWPVLKDILAAHDAKLFGVSSRFKLDLGHLGPPLVIVYVCTSLGSITGGLVSSKLIKRGWEVGKARKTTMLGLAILVTPITLSPWIENMWAMVALLSLAAAAHQGWSANLFTTTSDNFPRALVGSVTGIGGLAGALGATLFPFFVGRLLDRFSASGHLEVGYNVLFVICGLAYLVAWTAMHMIRPEPVTGQKQISVPRQEAKSTTRLQA